MLSPVRPSVCLSVRQVYHRKTVKVRIMKFHHTVAPSLQFLRCKFYPEILRGSPRSGASNKGGVGKSYFHALNVNILKTLADTAKVTINVQ